MPEDAGSIYSSIILKLDQLQQGVIKIESLMGRVEKSGKEKAKGFGSFWKNAFQTAFGVGVVQIIGKVTTALRNALNIFSGYEQSIRNVQSVTGAFGEDLRMIENAAKDAGETTRFTAREAADALYFLGSAGFSAQQSVAALNGVLQLAGATQSDLASTSETVASIISQYSLAADDAGRVSNVFAAAIGNSQATMEKLSNAFRQVGPVAAGFGISLEDTTGALQELFNAGFQGQQAGRALKSALADLASPTTNMEKIFKKLNISLKDVNPETNNLADIIDTLGESGASTADIIDAFGKVAGPQMAVLIQQGGNALREYTSAVTDTNAAAEAYAIQNDSLAGSLDFLRSKLESTAIAIFEKMSPGMRELIDNFIEFLDAAKPVGVLLGHIFNAIFKIASISTGAITGIFKALFSGFTEIQTPMKQAGEGLEKVRKSIQKAGEFGNTAKKINELTDEYESLQNKTNRTEKEQNRLKSIISQLEKLVPDAVTRFDDYGNAIQLSGDKSRTAARQMLIAREAALLQAKAEAEASKAIYQRILRTDKFAADSARDSRNRLIAQSRIAETRLSLLETFQQRFNELTKSGVDQITAYNQANQELGSELRRVGVEFPAISGGLSSLGKPFKIINETIEKSNTILNDLQKSLSKPTDVEIRYEDARKKLEELAALEKELEAVQKNISNLDKVDPVDKGAGKKADSLKTLIDEFWKDYQNGIEDATRESRLFGEEEDALKAKLDFLKTAYLDLLDKGLKPSSKTLIRIRQEYDLTEKELQALIEAEKEHTKTLDEKEKIEQKIVDITENYKNKLTELKTPEGDLIELERQRAKESVIAINGSRDATIKALEAIDDYYDELKKKSDETKEAFKFNVDEMLSAAASLADALSSLFASITDSRIAELDRQLQAELEAAGLAEETEMERLQRELDAAIEAGDEQRQAELENSIARLAIEEEYARKKAEIEYKGALIEWGLKLTGAIADLAKAILVATAAAPFPANLPAIGFAVAQGINVGAIASAKPQPPAFESGGVFLGPGSRGPTGGYMAELHPPETILNGEQMASVLNMINSNRGSTSGDTPAQFTIIYVQDSIETARQVVEVMNNGIVRLDPSRALERT